MIAIERDTLLDLDELAREFEGLDTPGLQRHRAVQAAVVAIQNRNIVGGILPAEATRHAQELLLSLETPGQALGLIRSASPAEVVPITTAPSYGSPGRRRLTKLLH